MNSRCNGVAPRSQAASALKIQEFRPAEDLPLGSVLGPFSASKTRRSDDKRMKINYEWSAGFDCE
jgi:hypothetical protein